MPHHAQITIWLLNNILHKGIVEVKKQYITATWLLDKHWFRLFVYNYLLFLL